MNPFGSIFILFGVSNFDLTRRRRPSQDSTIHIDMEIQNETLIQITDSALGKLVETAAKEAIDTTSTWLRIAVIPGGCSGLTYDLGWDTSKNDVDVQIEAGVFNVLIDPRSAAYLEGSTLDFSDGLEGKGFHFENPQAVRNCACGESFGL